MMLHFFKKLVFYPRFSVLTLGLIIELIIGAKPAHADHSLADAMNDNPTITEAVTQIQSVHGVICDVANSSQTYYYPQEKGELGTAWKQIALCYENQEDLQVAQAYFRAGGELGFYGTPNLVGVLVVSYTWENYQPTRLIAIEYL